MTATDSSTLGAVASDTRSDTALPVRNTQSARPADTSSEASDSSEASSSEDDSSSEEDDDDDDDEAEEEEEGDYSAAIPTKPTMRAPAAGDLKSRLAAFLPQLAQSNAEVEKLREKGEFKGMEDVDEGATYIEMDLGLGVLEEQKPGGEDEEMGDKEEEHDGEGGKDGEDGEEDVMGRLMGHKKSRGGAGISEV